MADLLDSLLYLPQMFLVKVSPDGQWVAWSWYRIGPGIDVFAARTDGSGEPIRLTENEQETLLVSWTPDSKAVIVAQDTDGDERSTLYRVDLDAPLTMQPLTDLNPPYFLRGGQLHPNGRWLIYAANYDFAAGAEIEPTCLYRHNLQTGERLLLARPEKGNYYTPELNRQGTRILYNRKDIHPSGYQLWVVDIDGQNDREIGNYGAEYKVYGQWLPDGERVLVLAETATHHRVGVLNTVSGETRWLIDDPARNIEALRVPPTGDRAVIIEVAEARQRCSLLDWETGEETRLPEVPGTLSLYAPAREGWVAYHASSRQPADLVLFKPDGMTSITRVWSRTSLKPDDLIPAEDFRWQSVDGLAVQGWLYRARGQSRGTIVLIHGGPTHHDEDRVSSEVQYYVSQGFNVLQPNYRGSTGFSRAYMEAIKAEGWGGREQDDIRTGIEALIQAGIAQPGKVGVTGTSYGGYSSWCQITRTPPEIVAASAPVCGMTDLVVDYETTRPDLRPYSEEMLGGSPTEIPQKYYERSPINFVQNIRGRLMIVQGLRDPNVTPRNVDEVKRALDQAGVEYELLVFDDEGHGILKPENQRRLYQQLAEFFASAFAD